MEIGKREMIMAIKNSKRKEIEEFIITIGFTVVMIAILIIAI